MVTDLSISMSRAPAHPRTCTRRRYAKNRHHPSPGPEVSRMPLLPCAVEGAASFAPRPPMRLGLSGRERVGRADATPAGAAGGTTLDRAASRGGCGAALASGRFWWGIRNPARNGRYPQAGVSDLATRNNNSHIARNNVKGVLMKSKNQTGRPKSQTESKAVMVHFPPAELAAVDDWRQRQTIEPSRSAALRIIIKRALQGEAISQ